MKTLNTISEREFITYVANRHAVRMRGRNKTYRLAPSTELLRNADSVESRLDGWFLRDFTDVYFGRGFRKISQSQAVDLLRIAHQLGTLKVL